MATVDSVKQKINNLIIKINKITEKEDKDLTSALNSFSKIGGNEYTKSLIIAFLSDDDGGAKTLKELIIPDYIESIAADRFIGYDFQKITIGEKCKSIGTCAFSECNQLTEIEIPETVTDIEGYAFGDCQNLKTLKLNTLNCITAEVFEDSPIQTIYIGHNVKEIPSNTFYAWSNPIEQVVIEDGCEKIGNYAFAEKNDLKFVNIPSSVKTIGYSAFQEDIGLEEIEIPETVTDIDYYYLFSGCTQLKTAILKDTSKRGYLGDLTFSSCSSLSSVSLPNHIGIIGQESFYNCSSLTEFDFNNIFEIYPYAFENSGLSNVYIPTDLCYIGDYAFANCKNLTNIDVSDDNNCYLSDNGVLYIKEYDADDVPYASYLSQYPIGRVNNEYTVLNKCRVIEAAGFMGAKNLTKINLPDGLTQILSQAFKDCENLETINLPDGLTYIGGQAFEDCENLETINLPDGLTYIGGQAFKDCENLETINLPDGLAYIGGQAFENTAWLNNQPKGLIYYGNNKLYGPSKATLDENIEVKAGTTTIGDQAFQNRKDLINITLPSGLKSIGYYAFYNCSNLKSINIPNSVTSVSRPWSTFYHCDSLTNITLEEEFNYPDFYLPTVYAFDLAETIDIETIVSWLEALKDRTDTTSYRLFIGHCALQRLSDEQKAIAINKNWTLS